MNPVLTETQRRQAVADRDHNFDGQFLYGVLSTRIFCRPSCPSRRPRVSAIRFFDDVAAAERAGFRACKRCRPELQNDLQTARIEKICAVIAENLDAPLSLSALSRIVNISASQLQREFKKATGISPREYSDALRLQTLKTKLGAENSVTHAAYDAGYNSSRALYERADSQLGMTPATYRKGGAGVLVAYDIAPCTLGFLLVATTPKGVCAVTLGDDEAQLEADLRSEFFAAQITRDAKQLRQKLQAVLEFLEGRQPRVNLSLDVRATAFQRRVWQELCAIPRGQTRSYSQVAAQIGKPSAARAVARACATNSVALVIPCHRVVRENGELSGYRWGIERKKKLLQKESEN
jgi:AraC family transcriptional regulator of adaptative response/methylated-DNA-[protein]-cysteine methyltransferase